MSRLARRATPLLLAAALPLLLAAELLSQQDRPPIPLLLAQDNDHPSSLRLLRASEREQLGDPFFELVLGERSDAESLDEIENLLQPQPSGRHTFVVDEALPDPRLGQGRRAVLAYSGNHRGRVLAPNVMLSVGFSSDGFPDRPSFIEAWGWDDFRGRYNYYRLDGIGLPPGLRLWKFRGSSEGADLLLAEERRGTCMECHVNGAPVMKELALPWNNWHSFSFTAGYLQAGASGAWPVASHPRLGERLRGAEDLETQFILPAITQFNNRRINAALARDPATGNVALDADGLATVAEAPRLLKHLFATTEVNLISARETSNLFPLPSPGSGPDGPVTLPATFLINANLIGGSTISGLQGLGLSAASTFTNGLTVTPGEYRSLVADSGQRLAGHPGDAAFAWFVPEASHVDNSMVERLLRRGVVTPQLVAAVLAIDLEAPVFSAERAALLRFVPASFRFRPGAAPSHPDELTREVIASLRDAEPEAGSPEAELLRRLEADDPVELLRQDVIAYRARLVRLLADPATRAAELRRLFDLAQERREALLANAVFGSLDETGGLLLFPRR